MASSKITVYTCVTGGKDTLLDQPKSNATYVAFTDFEFESKTWERKVAYDKFTDPRRNSRIQKMLPHQYLEADCTIYIDGNIRLLKTPEEIVEKYLKNHDLAVCKHPTRDCLYDEAITCAKRGLDDVETIIEQAKKYEDAGFAKHKGLCECGIIVRRNTSKVEQFNNAWWSEYCRHSRRDQISFMYAVDKVGLRINAIPDYFVEVDNRHAIKQSGDFEIVVHNHMI